MARGAPAGAGGCQSAPVCGDFSHAAVRSGAYLTRPCDAFWRPAAAASRSRSTDRDESSSSASVGAVSEVFGSSFTYGRQWLSEDGLEWALEFEADILGDKKQRVHGIDLVSLCDEGRIKEFTVLARPPKAVEALSSAMMQRVPIRLAKLKAKQALGLA